MTSVLLQAAEGVDGRDDAVAVEHEPLRAQGQHPGQEGHDQTATTTCLNQILGRKYLIWVHLRFIVESNKTEFLDISECDRERVLLDAEPLHAGGGAAAAAQSCAKMREGRGSIAFQVLSAL